MSILSVDPNVSNDRTLGVTLEDMENLTTTITSDNAIDDINPPLCSIQCTSTYAAQTGLETAQSRSLIHFTILNSYNIV